MLQDIFLRNARRATCHGRDELLAEILGSTQHISLVAPRRLGKSVVVREVERQIRELNTDALVICLNVRRDSADSNQEFIWSIGEKLKQELENQENEYADQLILDGSVSESSSRQISRLLKRLENDSIYTTVIIDQLDVVKQRSAIDAYLWDWLAQLADNSNDYLRFILASRVELIDLAKTVEEGDSTFWDLFTEIRLLPQTISDMRAWIGALEHNGFSTKGNLKELIHSWTGGLPSLLVALGNELAKQSNSEKTLTGEEVTKCADFLVADKSPILRDLWRDIGDDSQRVFLSIGKNGISVDKLARESVIDLRNQGYIVDEGGVAKHVCKLMFQYSRAHEKKSLTDLELYFGDKQDWEKHITGVLNLRLKSIDYEYLEQKLTTEIKNGMNWRISSKFKELIKMVTADPIGCLKSMREIHDLLHLVLWHEVLGKGPPYEIDEITADTIYELLSKKSGFRIPEWVKSRTFTDQDRNFQIQVLDYLTGNQHLGFKNFTSTMRKTIQRHTFFAASQIFRTQNHGQHVSIQETTPAMIAAAACLDAIVFLELLVDDLRDRPLER